MFFFNEIIIKINIKVTFCDPDLLQLAEVLEEFWKSKKKKKIKIY